MVLLRPPLSPFLKNYIRSLCKDLSSSCNDDLCLSLIEKALKYTCHVARIRSVAYATGFCAYYARLIEKMGVFEPIRENLAGKGKAIHRVLAFASQDLFMNYTLNQILQKSTELISDVVDKAVEMVSIANENELKAIREATSNLLEKLVKALRRTYTRKIVVTDLNKKLFPIVEQEFIDFDDHMYGAPDLILEDLDNGKAIVVEWKTYTVKGTPWNNEDIAQVVAYSILELRRLGISSFKSLFEAILGVDKDRLRDVAELARVVKKRKSGQEESKIDVRDLVNELLREAYKRIKVLPIIVSTSDSFPPHPLMYSNNINSHLTAKRLVNLYETIMGVIIASEYLTLQLTNVEALISKADKLGWEDVRNSLSSYCMAPKGYIFNYTPCRSSGQGFLPCGIPKLQRSWPCKTKKGGKYCPFAGADEVCKFYFDRPREDFDKLMWWLRYKIFEEKEQSFVNYRAVDLLFKDMHMKNFILSSKAESSCKGFKVNIAGSHVSVALSKDSHTCFINIERGGEKLGKVRFDIIDLKNVEEGPEEFSLIAKRKMREIERRDGIIGTVKRSVVASITYPNIVTPLLTINTFLMVRDVSVEPSSEVIEYYLYSPSVMLYFNFKLFIRYIKYLQSTNANAKLLLFEAPVNLTLMELRAVDALHRYIAKIKEHDDKKNIIETLKDLNLTEADVNKAVELDKKVLHESERARKEFESESMLDLIPAYKILRELIEKKVK